LRRAAGPYTSAKSWQICWRERASACGKRASWRAEGNSGGCARWLAQSKSIPFSHEFDDETDIGTGPKIHFHFLDAFLQCAVVTEELVDRLCRAARATYPLSTSMIISLGDCHLHAKTVDSSALVDVLFAPNVPEAFEPGVPLARANWHLGNG
jgi:hypothetical protein